MGLDHSAPSAPGVPAPVPETSVELLTLLSPKSAIFTLNRSSSRMLQRTQAGGREHRDQLRVPPLPLKGHGCLLPSERPSPAQQKPTTHSALWQAGLCC